MSEKSIKICVEVAQRDVVNEIEFVSVQLNLCQWREKALFDTRPKKNGSVSFLQAKSRYYFFSLPSFNYLAKYGKVNI